MTTGIFEFQKMVPQHVPFYVFQGQLSGEFTGVLTYRESEDYVDKDGKSRSRSRSVEYERPGIPFTGPKVDADSPMLTAVYAGFDYRMTYIEAALHAGLSERVLAAAVPLTAASAPPNTGIGAFTMKPSFAYNTAFQRLGREAASAAEASMSSPAVRRLRFTRRRGGSVFSSLFGGDVACPEVDWVQPDRMHAEDVRYDIHNARLHKRGVVLLPVWVVEYRYSGEPYRCFVSGLDGSVGGLTHLLSRDAVVRGASIGALLGLTGAALGKVPVYFALGPAGGALAGALTGYLMASQRASDWQRSGRRRHTDKESNRQWQAQRFWQDEAAVSAAYRREAMKYHPDHNLGKSEAELKDCEERFKQLTEAYGRLRRA